MDKENLPKPAVVDGSKAREKRHCCIGIAIAIFLLCAATVVFGAYLVSKEITGGKSPDKQKVDQAPREQSTTNQSNSGNKPTADTPSSATETSSAQIAEREKLLNFFIELANKDDTDKSWPGPIARWNKPSVSVGVGEGTFSERQSSCLNSYIADFNSVSINTKLFRDDTVDLGIPNIKIFYQDVATFAARSGGNQQYGYQEGQFNDDRSFKRAVVFLSEAIASLDPAVECQFIRHELTHGIGFWGHSSIYPESIMSLPKNSYSFNTADQKAIGMLYNSGIPLGAKEAEVRSYFANKDY